jgi:hypothetical protein
VRERLVAATISIGLIAATLSPVVRAPEDDGFPLSTYPMFAFARPTQLTIDYAIGVTALGARRPLSLAMLGTSEVLQARAMIELAVHDGRDATKRLCDAIAARVAADATAEDVAEIRIVTGTHDAIEYLVHGRIGREVVHIRCLVPR